MLGLCTICNSPVGRNKQYCPDCINELNEAHRLMELERAGDADVCYARWMAGSPLYMPNSSQHSETREPIRKPLVTWRAPNLRIKRDGDEDGQS